jgi:hypothetical protein
MQQEWLLRVRAMWAGSRVKAKEPVKIRIFTGSFLIDL